MSSSHDSSNILMTEAFLKKAFPDPKIKNFHTQLGVHFEEIEEMMQELIPLDSNSSVLLNFARNSITALSIALKTDKATFEISDRVAFLDALCDQLVTATGVGYMARMNVAEAFGEVNESNDSKFGPNGEAIYDENQKLMKGPDYFKPNLEPFV